MLYESLCTFRHCVVDHDAEQMVKDFSRMGQFFVMALVQLTYRKSLRDIQGPCSNMLLKGI